MPREVNPAGTVPVLLHHGHPVYESHEQIIYIDQVAGPPPPCQAGCHKSLVDLLTKPFKFFGLASSI